MKVTGAGCSFWSNYDGSVWASMIKQAAPIGQNPFAKNMNNKNMSVVSKLSDCEAAAIIDVIEKGEGAKWEGFHDSENQKLNLNFSHASYKDKNGNEEKGYSLSIYKQDKQDSQNKNSFKIGFKMGEARYLKEFLLHSLKKRFLSLDKEYEKKQEEDRKKKVEERSEEGNYKTGSVKVEKLSPSPAPITAQSSLPNDSEDIW